tara:strand:+ start:1353 stop:1706 length:354 start_codon:yes stop_codon:yes gene_type:complete
MKKGDNVKLKDSVYEGRRLYPQEESRQFAMQLRKVTPLEFSQIKAAGNVAARTMYKADIMHMDWTYEVHCTTCAPIYPGISNRLEFVSVKDPSNGNEFFVRRHNLEIVLKEKSVIIL